MEYRWTSGPKRAETLADDRGFPKYTAVAWVPSDAWTQSEEDKPGFCHWAIYAIEAVDMDNNPLYWRAGSHTNANSTTDLAEAQPEAHGTVKWDGCCNWDVHDDAAMLHACEARDLYNFSAALLAAYELAAGVTVSTDMRDPAILLPTP